MSRKNRPTAASWDSDEDLLQDDILGISAFQSSKEKEESDEELDEDALLGSDNEYGDTTVEKDSVPVPVKVDKPTTSIAPSAIPTQTNYQTHVKANDEHVEEYELLEVPSDADFVGEDVIEVADPSELDGFENGGGNLVEVDQDVTSDDFGAGDISGQSLEGLGNEGYNHPVDDYESFQSQEENYEDKTIKGFDESSESEDEEKGRGRFISERSNIISIATTKLKTRTDIPDTLEISEEQQAQIDQFLNERNRRGGRRGFRGGHDRAMRGGRQHVYGAWQNRSNMDSQQQQQASHQLSEQHKRTSHYQHHQPAVSSMSHTESEVYPITITGQGSYNALHNQPHNSNQHQQDSQHRNYHHQIQQPPLLPSHPSQSASHQSHMYQHQSIPSPRQHEAAAAVPHHYTQPTSVALAPQQQLMPPASTATVQLTQGTTTTSHQQQGRKILINPHFRGAKLDAPTQAPPVLSSASAMATSPLLPQPHQHYQPVPQQTPYVQPHTPDVWQTTAQHQPQHTYPSSSQPVMHSQTHYNPVSQTYQAAPVLQHQSLPHQPVQPIAPASSVVTQIEPITSQYSGAPQPIQSLAHPNQQPPVYPSSQQYPSTVPPRPVADQSMMFRQPPPQLPPVPPTHFMSSPPQQAPPQSPQHHAPLHPSHLHPPLQTSIPPPHHNTRGAPPLQQSFQSQPQQYQVQSAPHEAQRPSHQMPPPQHQLHHQQPGNAMKMHPPQNPHQRNLVNTSATRQNVFSKVHRKYQRIRGNLLVSPKRKRQEIQTQQNKNIKVLTTLPQVKLMSDASEPPNKIAKVSTHLKQLTQSDDSLDDDAKSMREKLELQKRMRAEVIRRKELRRLLHAEQRRKDLQDKLAEQGLTLADISEEQKAHFIEGTTNKQFGSVNRTLQPQVKGKIPSQTTQGQNIAAGTKRTAPQQLMGRPLKQIKVGSGYASQTQDKNTGQHANAQQNKTEAQAASNVILSEEQKNFYQKQYIPPHQQFQSASTSKKIKRILPNKNTDQKTQQTLQQKQDESKQQPVQSTASKAQEQQQQQPTQKSPSLQQQIRPLRGGKKGVLQGRTLSSTQIRMPGPNQGQVFGQQRPVLPGPNQPRPMRMQGQLRPGQPSNQPRHQVPGGPRPPPPGGNIRHPSHTGLRHPSQGILRHPGLQGHPRPMRGQPHLMGPPRQPRTGQEQLRPLYSPGQPRFMPPAGQQRPMMLQGRGGVRGMNIRGRGRGMLGRGGHPIPMAPQGDTSQQNSPQPQSKLPLTSPKQELYKKTKLILKKVVKGSPSQPAVPNNTQGTPGGKKVLVRKVNQSRPNQVGGSPQGNPGTQEPKPHILRNPVNRQIRMQGPNMAGGQMKFHNPMGRGQPPQRPMGPMNTRNMAAAKELANRRILFDGDGNSGKKATMIAVDNLSSSTTERTISQMAKSCGQVESLQLLKSQRKALIRFRAGDHAQHFFKKFHRHMLDLSHINVTVLPAS